MLGNLGDLRTGGCGCSEGDILHSDVCFAPENTNLELMCMFVLARVSARLYTPTTHSHYFKFEALYQTTLCVAWASEIVSRAL